MGQVKEWGGGGEESFLPHPLLFFGSLSISQVAKTENPVPRRSSVVLCFETTRKCLLHRLASVFTDYCIDPSTSKLSLTNYFKNTHLSKVGLLNLSQEVVILYSELTQKNSRGKKTANLE